MSKTKWKLADALKKLMKVKSIKKITIQDIVEESGMTRQSFYYHFHDIYEIIEWMCKNNLLKNCAVEEENPDAWIYQLFLNVKEDRKFYKKIVSELGREVVEKTIAEEIEKRMSLMFEIFSVKEMSIFSFLNSSLLNYLIIMITAQKDEITTEQIESIVMFFEISMKNYSMMERKVQYA